MPAPYHPTSVVKADLSPDSRYRAHKVSARSGSGVPAARSRSSSEWPIASPELRLTAYRMPPGSSLTDGSGGKKEKPTDHGPWAGVISGRQEGSEPAGRLGRGDRRRRRGGWW